MKLCKYGYTGCSDIPVPRGCQIIMMIIIIMLIIIIVFPTEKTKKKKVY